MALTVQQAIQLMKQADATQGDSVDILEFGSPDMEVRGIAVAFKATQFVIEEAARLGANLLITHESTFYSHRDDPDQRLGGIVAGEKARWIEQSGIAIYRNHDDIHRAQPDGITTALVQRLRWEDYIEEQLAYATLVALPELTLVEAAEHAKLQLGLPFVRFVGNIHAQCRRVGILVGYRGGGALAIPLMEQKNLDLLIVGEGPEWETPEYVRDAAELGYNKSLLVLGHAESEDAGMERLAIRLQSELSRRLHDIPVHFIAAKPLFQLY